MKYEKPIINIALFETENIVMTSGITGSTDLEAAQQAAQQAADGAQGNAKVITITF